MFHRKMPPGMKRNRVPNYDRLQAIDEAIHYLDKKIGRILPTTVFSEIPFSRDDIAQVIEETTGVCIKQSIHIVNTIGELAAIHETGGDRVIK